MTASIGDRDLVIFSMKEEATPGELTAIASALLRVGLAQVDVSRFTPNLISSQS